MNKMEQHKEMEMPLEEKRLEIELQTENLTALNRQNEKQGEMENEIKATDEEKAMCLKSIKNWLKEEEKECAIAKQQEEMEREVDRKRQEEMKKQEDLQRKMEAETQIEADRIKMEKESKKDKHTYAQKWKARRERQSKTINRKRRMSVIDNYKTSVKIILLTFPLLFKGKESCGKKENYLGTSGR